QQLGHRIHVLPLALMPAPAVNADHRWEWAAALAGQGKVEPQLHPVGLAIDDVALDTNLRLLSLRCRRDCEGTSKGHEHHPREAEPCCHVTLLLLAGNRRSSPSAEGTAMPTSSLPEDEVGSNLTPRV